MLSQALAPVRQDGAKRPPAGAIADKAFVVAKLLIVGIDGDGRQDPAAVGQGYGRGSLDALRCFFHRLSVLRCAADGRAPRAAVNAAIADKLRRVGQPGPFPFGDGPSRGRAQGRQKPTPDNAMVMRQPIEQAA